jgi:Ca2+-binding RTX toxin-like protein
MADILASIATTAVLEGFGAESGTFSGQLEKAGDHDWIKVELIEGETYSFYLSFLNTNSLTNGNSTLGLRNAAGGQFLGADDGGVGFNSLLVYPVPIGQGGVYFLDVGAKDNLNAGEYSLFSASGSGLANHVLSDGNDTDDTGVAGDRMLGGKGADYIDLNSAKDALGEQGNDIIIGNQDSNRIAGGLGDDTIDGGEGSDALFGDAGNDNIFGGEDFDTIFGGAGSDVIDGGSESDQIYGGAGKDLLTGGLDNDTYNFTALTDSRKGALRDVILDFSSSDGDMIGLNQIDAKKGGGDNAFHFIGKQHFHHKAGELHFVNKGAFLLVEGDVNGDGKADFQIEVHGVATLAPGDFFL